MFSPTTIIYANFLYPFADLSFIYNTFIAETQPASIKSSLSSVEHGNPITADQTQPKLHAQKRGGNEMKTVRCFQRKWPLPINSSEMVISLFGVEPYAGKED